jgi:hypothetical protein
MKKNKIKNPGDEMLKKSKKKKIKTVESLTKILD